MKIVKNQLMTSEYLIMLVKHWRKQGSKCILLLNGWKGDKGMQESAPHLICNKLRN